MIDVGDNCGYYCGSITVKLLRKYSKSIDTLFRKKKRMTSQILRYNKHYYIGGVVALNSKEPVSKRSIQALHPVKNMHYLQGL